MESRIRECQICGKTFIAGRKNQVCCSTECKLIKIKRCSSERNKARYAIDEEFRRRKIETARRYQDRKKHLQ